MTSIAPNELNKLHASVRNVPDYPKPGIVFKDITPLLGAPALFALACDEMAAPFGGSGITHVVAIESRGFIFGGAIALRLSAGLVPVRKVGKLPFKTERVEYALEYGTDALEVHIDALTSSSRVLIVDDVLATGGTAAATRRLVERLGAVVAGATFLIRLTFLPGASALPGITCHGVLDY